MFRKKHTVKGKNVIGGKEMKVLRERTLSMYFGDATEACDSQNGRDAMMDSFFPKKSQCVQIKWQYSAHFYAHVYTVNDVALCFEVFGLPEFDVAVPQTFPSPQLFPSVFGILRLRQLFYAEEKAASASTKVERALFEHLKSIATVAWSWGQTSTYVLRGAHMMVPGIHGIAGRGKCTEGGLVLLCTMNSAIPYAVGIASKALIAGIRDTAVDGRSGGVGVVVLNSVGDALWESFVPEYQLSSAAKEKIKCSDFIVPKIFAQGTEILDGSDVLVEPRDSSLEKVVEEPLTVAEGQNGAESDVTTVEVENAPSGVPTGEPSENLKEDTAAAEERTPPDAAEDGEDDDLLPEEQEGFERLFESIDDVLSFSLCEAIKGVKASSLPLPLTTFTNVLNQSVPRGLDANKLPGAIAHHIENGIDWKKTSFKKALPFLQSVGSELLTLKEVTPGVHQIVKINKSASILQQHKRKHRDFILAVHTPAIDASVEQDFGDGSAGKMAARMKSEKRIESVDVVYRPKRSMHPELERMLLRCKWSPFPNEGTSNAADGPEEAVDTNENEDDDDDEVVTAKRIKDNLRCYLTRRKLLTPPATPQDKPTVAIDRILSMLWPDNAKCIPNDMSLIDLDTMVMHAFCPMHLVTYAGSGVAGSTSRLRNGKPPSIDLHTEKRSGNKVITIVRNVDAFGFFLEAVLSTWRQRFATSGSVVDPSKDMVRLKSGTKVPREIHVQGDLVAEVSEYLAKEMGVPRLCITVKGK